MRQGNLAAVFVVCCGSARRCKVLSGVFELLSEADVSARYLPSTLARTWITRHFVACVFVVALALPHTLRRLLLVCGVLQSLVHTVLQQGAVLASPGLNPFDKQPGTACSGASSVWCYQASVVLSSSSQLSSAVAVGVCWTCV